MSLLRRLLGSRAGASAAEFALVTPLFVGIVFASVGVARVYWASAGIQNGLGEAARAATLFPYPGNETVQSVFRARTFGVPAASIPTPVVTTGTANGQQFVNITVTYSPIMDLHLFGKRPLTMTYSRRAYIPSG